MTAADHIQDTGGAVGGAGGEARDVRACLDAFARHLLATSPTAPKYQALQVGALRDLCDWHAREYGCALRIADLTPETLRLYRAHRAPLDSAVTLNRKRAAWSAFCSWAVAQGWLTDNPCERVRRVRPPLYVTGRRRRAIRPARRTVRRRR